ncbi:mannose-1-phosphate guanylyltransferase/mannose-6-phosphate isomerase [Candidatus Thioglobus sp.]|nr:mannose-1-phosphate guanylyltransferase/mannose-6-phosphate isomerase [Candidatus Thioglobus sp.]
MKIIAVILSGGSGTRLWPLSRKKQPKQYLSLASENSMLQETILRLDGLENLSEIMVVCNEEHRFIVAEQLQKIDIDKPYILLEPTGRNTAPAIAAAALEIIKNENAIMLVLSADHVIGDKEAFHKVIDIAAQHAKSQKLVTFGIPPDGPNTEYGYIKLSSKEEQGAFKVEKFTEKPNIKKATSYFKQGKYLWNSGMFVFQANTLINELSIYSADMLDSVSKSVDLAKQDLDFIRLDLKSFSSSPSDSIDYALMEKSNNVVVIPLDAGWNDLGSWAALYDVNAKNNDGNVIRGDVYTEETYDSLIYADHHMLATIGLKDLVIVDTPNATLIASKEKAHMVTKIVAKLQKQHREEQLHHRKVYRPWGWYDVVESGEYFQVKRLHVKPKAKLSLQLHFKRSEHWIVIKGVAKATNGEENLTLKKGQSTFIPIGVKHSLENQEDESLEIIEVQSGTYLGEDDIQRFEDIYGRINS